MTRQIPFDLPVDEKFRREDFFASQANALALRALENWRDWPGGKLLLIGPSGAGKTHLAHVWALESGAARLSAGDLGRADVADLARQLGSSGALALEDGQRLEGDQPAQEALFHLHDRLLPHGRLMVTADRPVRDWGLSLPDLRSRLEASFLVRLEPPDDALLTAVLVKLFADRQLVVPAGLISWLVARMERSVGAARALVAELDRRALAEGKPIGRAMAAAVLEGAGDSSPRGGSGG